MLRKLPDSKELPYQSTLSQLERIDHLYRALMANGTGGLSPISFQLLMMNWLLNLATAPGKQVELSHLAYELISENLELLVSNLFQDGDELKLHEPHSDDHRFHFEGWNSAPFNFYKNMFLSTEAWWDCATTQIHGLSQLEEKAINFSVRQFLDMWAPTNFIPTNPDLLDETKKQQGLNLLKGFVNLLKDITPFEINHMNKDDVRYKVGKNLAITPGKVVYRNHLMELIQYEPQTKSVHPEPILICPAWIMKYYILDLSERNSLVRFLTSKGFTVFMISWKNPTASDAHYGLDDYRLEGPVAALDQIQKITGAKQVHTAGYCLGGTLLSLTAAQLAREGDDRIKSLTLFAAQTDFTEAGEILLFINESQVSFLEDMMQEKGYLEGDQMSGAFKLLRSNDLFWLKLQQDYLKGDRLAVNDLMAWNADATRMPYKMHSEYLRKLFLNNELATEKYEIDGHPVSLRDIHMPIFAVGTETDHVAPWKSVFKIHSLSRSDVTFVLTKGGHNAGIVSEPGHPRRYYRVLTTKHQDCYVSPDEWGLLADKKEGSWWPEWSKWLARKSGKKQTPPKMGTVLCDAPGTYVMGE